jgi:NADH dehydrogenase
MSCAAAGRAMGVNVSEGSPSRRKIVVVGAGFGGMAVVQSLKGVEVDITLIDRTNHHLFQPLLYQVATAALSPAEIATATRVLLRRYHNATVLMAEVTGVDPAQRRVRLANGVELPYDYLVLATARPTVSSAMTNGRPTRTCSRRSMMHCRFASDCSAHSSGRRNRTIRRRSSD